MKNNPINTDRNLNVLNEPNSKIEHLRRVYNVDTSGEYSLVRREFEEMGGFNFFNGKGKISSAADVAYIFKQLENKAVENAFAVMVKNGEPTVIHLGMGSLTSTNIDFSTLIAAENRLNPDKIYFVHNHPSGNITASGTDLRLYERMQEHFGNKLQNGIIINLDSGNFGVFDSDFADYGQHKTLDKKAEHIPVKVYSFTKQVFDKDYKPEHTIRYSEDVAKAVSSHRLGNREKMGFLITNNNTKVVGNVFLPYTEINKQNIDAIADEMVVKAGAMMGVGVFQYGNFSGVDLCSTLAEKIKTKSFQTVKMHDAVYINKEKGVYASWAENGEMLTGNVAELQVLPTFNESPMQYSFDFNDPFEDSSQNVGETLRTQPVFGSTKKTIEKIDDFGEKIGGAKKDLARSYIDTLSSVTRMDIASKPLSEVFPRPNYNQLIEDGKIDQPIAIMMNFLYDSIGAKPKGRYKYGIEDWTGKVLELSNVFKETIEYGGEFNKEIFDRFGYRNLEEPKGIFSVYRDLMNGLDFPRVDVRLGSGKSKYKPIRYDDGSYALVKDYFQVASGKDISEFVEEVKTLSSIFPEKKAAFLNTHKSRIGEKPLVLKVWGYRHGGEKFIATGTKYNLTTLATGFKTSDQAWAYIHENREALEQKFRDIKEFPFERRDVNEQRNGEDYRLGKTITPQMFADTFGFRGVEFGNWVNQAERQGSLNEAYDALLDLAKVVGIEPKAISLGGELGLAFGARGSGKANAHYEPNKTVINLTKTRGSGSLAHEWWHAVDNYFAKKTTGFSMMSDGASSNNDGIRSEVSKAWKELNFGIENKAFGNSFAHRSERIDKFKSGSKKYWGTPREMSARAFEAHVVEELAKRGIKNDYLANIKELPQWKNEDKLDENSTYPYPTKHEREMLAPKFQNLFDNFQQIQNIETRQMMLNEPEMDYGSVKKENIPNADVYIALKDLNNYLLKFADKNFIGLNQTKARLLAEKVLTVGSGILTERERTGLGGSANPNVNTLIGGMFYSKDWGRIQERTQNYLSKYRPQEEMMLKETEMEYWAKQNASNREWKEELYDIWMERHTYNDLKVSEPEMEYVVGIKAPTLTKDDIDKNVIENINKQTNVAILKDWRKEIEDTIWRTDRGRTAPYREYVKEINKRIGLLNKDTVETIFDKIENLNDRERAVYTEVLELAKNGDTVKEFNFDELKIDGFSQAELKGYISQLTQKGLIEKLDGSYYDFQVATTGMDVLQEPIVQYNQTSTADMNKKIEFLSEKIDDSWFKNAEIDYGIIGGVEKLSYVKEADVLLVVTKKENGFDPLQTIAITHASGYNAEQLYDVWMEQYSTLDMMMLREPEMPYQNKQMTCFESTEKIWEWNDLNIPQSELSNTALSWAENYWYDRTSHVNPSSKISEFHDQFGKLKNGNHDDYVEKYEPLLDEYSKLCLEHRDNPEVYTKYIDDLLGVNDLWVAVIREEPITDEIKKAAALDIEDFLSIINISPKKANEIVEEKLAEYVDICRNREKETHEIIVGVHNGTIEREDAILDLKHLDILSRGHEHAQSTLDSGLTVLEVKDITNEVFVGMYNKTLADYEYTEACRDIAELYNVHFDVATKFLEQSLAHKELEIKNTKIEVGDKELDYDQKFRVLVNKDIVVISGVTMNDRKSAAIVRLNEKGEVEKEYRYPKEKQKMRVMKKSIPTMRKGSKIGV